METSPRIERSMDERSYFICRYTDRGEFLHRDGVWRKNLLGDTGYYSSKEEAEKQLAKITNQNFACAVVSIKRCGGYSEVKSFLMVIKASSKSDAYYQVVKTALRVYPDEFYQISVESVNNVVDPETVEIKTP
jgi:hypothetical protein